MCLPTFKHRPQLTFDTYIEVAHYYSVYSDTEVVTEVVLYSSQILNENRVSVKRFLGTLIFKKQS